MREGEEGKEGGGEGKGGRDKTNNHPKNLHLVTH